MITERTLRKWRKEALKIKTHTDHLGVIPDSPAAMKTKMAERILRLTQELLDQHLLRK